MKKLSILFVAMLVLMSISVQVNAAITTTSSNDGDLSKTKAILISLINQDPDPSISGETVELRLGVQNIGGKNADNVVIEVVPGYPFESVAGQSLIQNLGTIKSYQDEEDMKIIKFEVKIDKDAVSGTYPLKVLQYEEGKKDEFSVSTNINIDVSSTENAEVIYIDKTELVPGKQTEIRFTINNVGSAPLRDLRFSWTNADDVILPVGSDNTKYIKYIDVGESANVTYNVIADSSTTAGLYKLDLTLEYGVSGTIEERTLSTVAGIYVGGGTDFDVVFSDESSDGMSFTIANIGSNPAYSVSVSVPSQQGWSSSGSSSSIIGNLNSGDYTIMTFPITSSSSSNSLRIVIAYTDTKGERVSLEKSISLGDAGNSQTFALQNNSAGFNGTGNYANFRGAGSRNSGGIDSVLRSTPNMTMVYYIIAAIAVAIIAIAGGLYYRKKRVKKKRDSKKGSEK